MPSSAVKVVLLALFASFATTGAFAEECVDLKFSIARDGKHVAAPQVSAPPDTQASVQRTGVFQLVTTAHLEGSTVHLSAALSMPNGDTFVPVAAPTATTALTVPVTITFRGFDGSSYVLSALPRKTECPASTT
jgi:hypothetical protein